MFVKLVILNLAIMLCCWVWATFNRRVGIVDVAWSGCLALNIMLTAIFVDLAPMPIRLFIGILSGVWFIRLSAHLLRRYLAEQHEDTRYANMRRAMGKFQHFGFLLFFIFQAGLVVLFYLPMWALLTTPQQDWSVSYPVFLAVAALILVLAFVGETIADQQLYRFKQQSQHRGLTMDQGLWRYSRHPNYFFEWIHWFAYPILGVAAGLQLLWVYPVLMWLFLYYITGIPFSEQQALKNRGQNYLDYQQRTSMFIPWKPKK